MARPDRAANEAVRFLTMKPKHWRIEDGAIVPCSPFDVLRDSVQARTKAEALAIFLTRAQRMHENPPWVYVRNGALLLITHNGNAFIAESGALPADSENEMRPFHASCIAHHDTFSKAKDDASFAYYASADYQRIRAAQLASLKPEAIQAAQSAQALSDAQTMHAKPLAS